MTRTLESTPAADGIRMPAELHEISLHARRRLEAATDARGRPFEIHLLHQPGPLHVSDDEARGIDLVDGSRPRLAGDRLAASYCITQQVPSATRELPYSEPSPTGA